MKFSRIWLVPIFILFCIGAASAVESYVKMVEVETKVDIFDAEIKGLTNMQKSQMEFSQLQVTINQLTFCLQATQIENEELSNKIQHAFQEVNILQLNMQQMGMFIDRLLEDNADLKKQFEKEKTT